ncbi:MAG: MarR family transcriptional regulator [Eubacterium sp.]|nr:MarR family transcriptional regulator [Eubacterium sp.]
MGKYDCIRLENQLCFPLYACSKAVTKHYKPFLDKLDLTYTQYITMMVLWDKKEANVKDIGAALYLDSGTLTPVIKKLEAKGYIEKKRSKDDERSVIVEITDKGDALKDEAVKVPAMMGGCMQITEKEAETLYQILYKILGNVEEEVK